MAPSKTSIVPTWVKRKRSEDASFRGMGIRDFAGDAILSGHDLTDDGIDDLVVSAPGDAEGEAGAVHVVFGQGM